jgi:predicted naringenin-chalcone synthase
MMFYIYIYTQAVTAWGGRTEDITHVLAITCTGVIVPGIEFHVMQVSKERRLGICIY